MRVPDEVLKCVAFLAYDGPDGPKLAGTAFLLSRALLDSDRVAVYLVTAKHVIDGIRQDAIAPHVYVRLNTQDGGVATARTPIEDWVSHPDDPFVDVAILPWAPPEEIVEFLVVPESMIATEEVIQAQDIGIGDDVFLTGLFSNHFGRHRNIPIVRVGSIAAMPGEPVETNFHGTKVAIDAYLVEVRSIGGLSGSPVFVMTSGFRRGGVIRFGPHFYLLGLVHGHWDIDFTAADAVVPDGIRAEAVNMGIAMVVPATKILEVTDRPEFVQRRFEVAAENTKQHPDSRDPRYSGTEPS